MKLRALGILKKGAGRYESMGESILFIGGMGTNPRRLSYVTRLYL
jgi:hypothetical protein|nr:MAG: hypothetical protein [Bacteriophage sp.]